MNALRTIESDTEETAGQMRAMLRKAGLRPLAVELTVTNSSIPARRLSVASGCCPSIQEANAPILALNSAPATNGGVSGSAWSGAVTLGPRGLVSRGADRRTGLADTLRDPQYRNWDETRTELALSVNDSTQHAAYVKAAGERALEA